MKSYLIRTFERRSVPNIYVRNLQPHRIYKRRSILFIRQLSSLSKYVTQSLTKSFECSSFTSLQICWLTEVSSAHIEGYSYEVACLQVS